MSIGYEPSTQDKAALRNRERMLAKVKRFWITGVLEESLSGVAQLQLQMKYDPKAVAPPWRVAHWPPAWTDRLLPDNLTIAEVFDEAGGELLILGAPGSGKTIMLLNLARTLIKRAETDPSLPMPVVFNLSSWAETMPPLKAWLVDELNIRYQVPRKIGKQWIDSDGLLLLLDGLDEVEIGRREACVEAINDFRQEHGFAPIVICSRSDDYATLKGRLRLQVAVALQPLLPAQVETALAAEGQRFDAVRAILDEDAKLRELITSPLMLNITLLAYGSLSTDDLTDFNSLEDRRKHLFEGYVEAMLFRRAADAAYHPMQVKRQLAWLARYMSQRAQMIFSIESLQPDALPPRGRKLHALNVSLLLSLSFGLVIGIAAWLISKAWWFGPIASYDGLAAGLAFAMAIGLAYWLTRGGSFGIAFGISVGLAVGIPMALTLRSVELGLLSGLSVAVISGLVGWFSFGSRGTLVVSKDTINSVEILSWSWRQALLSFAWVVAFCAIAGIVTLSGYGLVWGTGVGIITGLFFALARGLTPGEVALRVMPNQGIRWTAYNAARVGVGIAVVAGIITGFVRLPGIMLGGFVSGSLPYGLALGLFGWTFFGGLTVIQHVTLRLMLWQRGFAPLNYAAFLDHCAERILLRKVGGGYMFVHRLLLAYFVDLEIGKPKRDKH